MAIKFFRCACSEQDGERFTSCWSHRDNPEPRDPANEILVNFVEPAPVVPDPNAPPSPSPLLTAVQRVTSLLSALNQTDPERKAHAEALAVTHNLFP